MPAAVRGVRRADAKPRAKVPASPARSRPSTKGAQGAKGARQHGSSVSIPPQAALAAAAAVLVLGIGVTLGTGGRGERLMQTTTRGFQAQLGNLGFRLKAVHVQGASAMAQPDVLAAAGLYKDQPLIGLDLDAIRAGVEQVGWVKEARVVRLLPDTLVIHVTERDALAVWQHGGRTVVIDKAGRVIPEAEPAKFPDLPLIVGVGAAEQAGAILPAVMQRPRLRQRLEALIRVDNRRWDLRLKDGSLVQLPAVDEEAALIRLDQLDRRQRILELGFARIDLRDPELVAVRPREGVPLSPGAAPTGLVADGA